MSNAKILEDKSFGLTVDKFTVNKETLRRTVLEVINNPIYREQTRKVAELMTDVEMTGLEKSSLVD
ncbi:hypothetical protein NQ317_004009 [Molorchus minor]|uniref:Uncharacterized protein n=1 Tax=Molorchus minor TaxID=1323400 RepID=A0ABQ9JSM4_9CUCU|nr:hypothetical protein NQ317_004009 [Molorchus minor]